MRKPAGRLIVNNMIDDGRIIFDRSDFWKNYMQKFKAHVRHLGARKVTQKDRWCWDLKPYYRPGQGFEI